MLRKGVNTCSPRLGWLESIRAGVMATASPYGDPKSKSGASMQLLRRLEQCWNEKLNWDLLPSDLKEVKSKIAG